MLKPLEVQNAWEKVRSAAPERKIKVLDELKTGKSADLNGKKISFFSSSFNKAKKGDKVYAIIARNLCKMIKDMNATGVLDEINELVISDTRSFFYLGIIS